MQEYSETEPSALRRMELFFPLLLPLHCELQRELADVCSPETWEARRQWFILTLPFLDAFFLFSIKCHWG